MGSQYDHLDLSERRCIYYWRHYDNLSMREMARRLGRNHSTISREIKRNSGCWCEQYYHNPADWLAKTRLRKRVSRKRLKCDALREYVNNRLRSGWTPELISGRLRRTAQLPYVCHETIYQYIYKEAPELIDTLPRKHKQRRKKCPYRSSPKKIEAKTSILDRPSYIADRKAFGHWESDSVESSCRQRGLNVLVERKSRYTKISWLETKKSEHSALNIIRRLKPLPSPCVQSITYDNGPENARHLDVNKALGTESYFCQPYHSWEKGTVEQTISLIRRYIPKSANLTAFTKRDIYRIELLLNHRPRKCLGYRTPYEVFYEQVGAL